MRTPLFPISVGLAVAFVGAVHGASVGGESDLLVVDTRLVAVALGESSGFDLDTRLVPPPVGGESDLFALDTRVFAEAEGESDLFLLDTRTAVEDDTWMVF